jgi:hypothetical protein
MFVRRRSLLAAGLALPVVARAAPKVLRVGFQKGEPILMATRSAKSLETALGPQGIGVEWIEFQFGPPMLEAMRVGSIDVGAVGDTPPVFAQAARGDLMYIAALHGAPQSLLLPVGSKIGSLAELRGKKIAFGRGSSAHHFLLMILEKAGLRYDQIEPAYLGPADAGAAFERGAVEAWSIWEPYTSLFNTRDGVRTLTTNTEIGDQFGFAMASGPFVRGNPDLVGTVLDVLAASGARCRADRGAVAGMLSEATGMAADVWGRAIAGNPFEVLPLTPALIAGQQRVADRFRALGLIPVDIRVADIAWQRGAKA